MKRISLIVLTVLLPLITKPQDEPVNKHTYHRIVVGFGLGAQVWRDGLARDANIFGGFRFGNNRHLIGGALQDLDHHKPYSVNNVSIEEDGVNYILTGRIDFSQNEYKLFYQYYWNDPVNKKLNLKAGITFGLLNSRDMYYAKNAQPNSQLKSYYVTGWGFGSDLVFTAEYALRWGFPFIEAGMKYTKLNSRIDFFERSYALAPFLRLGFCLDFGTRTSNIDHNKE